MYYTQKELMIKNSKVVKYYQNAKEIWKEIDIDDVNFSKVLTEKQSEFEHNCGDRGLGQEIMA